MNHTEQRIWLIKELQKDPSQLSDYPIPADEQEQKDLLRGLMNIWMPNELSDEFLQIQDEYLSEENRRAGITDIDDFGCLRSDDVKYVSDNEQSKKYLLHKGDILMARTGATFGKTLYFNDDNPAVYASFLIKIALDNSVILNRYYWHFAQSSFYWDQAKRFVSTGGQQQFNTNAVSRVIIPVPPIKEQERIITVLDRFDALCNDLTSGLPAEIEARRKQYEYYRDKLLTFKNYGE